MADKIQERTCLPILNNGVKGTTLCRHRSEDYSKEYQSAGSSSSYAATCRKRENGMMDTSVTIGSLYQHQSGRFCIAPALIQSLMGARIPSGTTTVVLSACIRGGAEFEVGAPSVTDEVSSRAENITCEAALADLPSNIDGVSSAELPRGQGGNHGQASDLNENAILNVPDNDRSVFQNFGSEQVDPVRPEIWLAAQPLERVPTSTSPCPPPLDRASVSSLSDGGESLSEEELSLLRRKLPGPQEWLRLLALQGDHNTEAWMPPGYIVMLSRYSKLGLTEDTRKDA
ncbi:hypothetical protein ACN47E_000745 [Coniothyrium glycines]